MTLLLRSIAFGIMTGLYSIAVTYSTVGFPIATMEDQLRVAALFVVSGIGGIYSYRRDPEKVWNIGPGAAKIVFLLLLLFAVSCSMPSVSLPPPQATVSPACREAMDRLHATDDQADRWWLTLVGQEACRP